MLAADHLSLYTALISGGAALLGALVGGAVTGWFTLKGEDKRQRFSREEALEAKAEREAVERRLVLGTARVVDSALYEALTIIAVALNARTQPMTMPRDEIPSADLQRLTAALSDAEWLKVMRARLSIATVAERRGSLTRDSLLSVERGVEEAREAIRRLAWPGEDHA